MSALNAIVLLECYSKHLFQKSIYHNVLIVASRHAQLSINETKIGGSMVLYMKLGNTERKRMYSNG